MNSKWHLYISFAKSLIRIAGCLLAIIYKQWDILAYGLLIAELLGILEELGDKR